MSDNTKTKPVSTIKPKKLKEAPAQSAPAVDPILISKVHALRALTNCFNLFSEGMFKKEFFQDVHESQMFIRHLHDQMTAEVLAHPDSDKVQELKTIKDQKAARLNELKALANELGASNGKA